MVGRLNDYTAVEAHSPEAAELFAGQSVEEIMARQEVIDVARKSALNVAGINLAQSCVEALPGDTAGQYHTRTQAVKMDQDLLIHGTAQQVTRVLGHEAKHHQNITKGNGVRIQSLEAEEALTEMAAAREDGGAPIAYKDFIAQTKALISKSGHSVPEMLDLYCDGQNAEINSILTEAKSATIH